jgi:hypothetical protein
LGDGWIFNTAATPSDVSRSMARLDQACAEIGRDASAIPVRAMVPSATRLGIAASTIDGKVDAIRSYATALVDAGATHVSISLGSFVRDLDEAQHVVREVAQHLGSMQAPAGR